MTPEEEEKHACCKRVAGACSMVVKGVWELQEAMEQLNTIAQCNHEMMLKKYEIIY